MSWRPPPKPGRFQITTTLLRARVSSATFSNVFATTTTRFLIYSIARDAYSFHWILIVWLVLFLLLPPNGICPWERERLSRKRCLFLMKKSRTLPSRFYQASLPPVVLYCGTVPLCFAVQITVSPHSTHTIKEKEKETKIWKPHPSISFFFLFGPYLYCGSSDLLLTLRLTFYIDGKNFFFDLVKKIIFLFSYFADEREAEPEFQVRRASPRPSSVQRKRFSPALTAAHSISKVRQTLSFSFSDWK